MTPVLYLSQRSNSLTRLDSTVHIGLNASQPQLLKMRYPQTRRTRQQVSWQGLTLDDRRKDEKKKLQVAHLRRAWAGSRGHWWSFKAECPLTQTVLHRVGGVLVTLTASLWHHVVLSSGPTPLNLPCERGTMCAYTFHFFGLSMHSNHSISVFCIVSHTVPLNADIRLEMPSPLKILQYCHWGKPRS